MPEGYSNGGVTAYRDLMSEYSFPWWRRSTVNDFYFARNERIPQYETERVMRARVAALDPVDTYYGWNAAGIDQDDHGVTVEIAGDTEERKVDTDWVVGCDGSHSTVRIEAGIAEDRSDHDRKMVLLVFRSKELDGIVSRFGEVSFFKILEPGLSGYWKFLGRVDTEGGWFFHAPVREGVSDDPEEVEALLHDAVGAQFGLETEHVGFWDLRIAVARRYRKGRVFIAGDAAHSHPPYGGYGINTGLEDVRNLGWKLAAVTGGWGGDALLDSYEEERLPVFRSTAADFIEAFIESDRKFLQEHDPEWDREDFTRAWDRRAAAAGTGVADFEPHYEGSPLVFGTEGAASGAVGEHTFRARPGHHLPPCELSGERDLFTALGRGFALVALDTPGSAIGQWRDAADRLGMPLAVVEDDSGDERGLYGASLILVRPDHYVCWAGEETPPDPTEIMMRAVGVEAAKTPRH
jgi:hypothetical protein